MYTEIEHPRNSTKREYTIYGCRPILDCQTWFLSQELITVVRLFESVRASGHIIDANNTSWYVIMGNELAVIGKETGYPYRVAKLRDDEKQYLEENRESI